MASLKSVSFSQSMTKVAVVVVVMVVGLGSMMSEMQGVGAQNVCSNQLSSLNVCAPFVVPGASNTQPSTDCCTALEAVNHDCLCNTIRIASQLPSLCQIPRFACDAN